MDRTEICRLEREKFREICSLPDYWPDIPLDELPSVFFQKIERIIAYDAKIEKGYQGKRLGKGIREPIYGDVV